MTCLESTRRFPDKNSQIDFIVPAKHKDSYVCPKCGSTRIGIYNQKYNHSFLYCNNCKGNNIVMADKFSKYNISVKENECNFACMKTGHALACSQGNRIHTDEIECFWAMLKRGVHGVFHNPPVEHIQKYTAESCCRLDHRDNNEDFTSSVGPSITQQHDCQHFTNGGG